MITYQRGEFMSANAIILTILMPFMFPIILVSIIIGFVVFRMNMKYKNSKYGQVSGNSFLKTINDRGNYGEYLTFQFLEKLQGNNKILTNVYIPREDGTTEIDLIMLNNSGIYVFESKNYSGWIFGDEKYKNWTQSLKGGRKNRFFNPVWQNKAHINALKKLIPQIENRYFYSYIVFSQRCELKKVSVSNPNVRVVKRDSLFSILKNDISERPVALSDVQINEIYKTLEKYSLADAKMKERHVEYIRGKI